MTFSRSSTRCWTAKLLLGKVEPDRKPLQSRVAAARNSDFGNPTFCVPATDGQTPGGRGGRRRARETEAGGPAARPTERPAGRPGDPPWRRVQPAGFAGGTRKSPVPAPQISSRAPGGCGRGGKEGWGRGAPRRRGAKAGNRPKLQTMHSAQTFFFFF